MADIAQERRAKLKALRARRDAAEKDKYVIEMRLTASLCGTFN